MDALPFSGCDQKLVVTLPSLNSPERSEGDGRCWANLQNTHFSGLTRKNSVFERSVLKYVSIKNRILTPSGQKSRVCVNTLDRLLPPEQRSNLLLYFSNFSQAATIPTSKLPCNFRQILPFSGCDQKLVVTLPSLYSPERSEGDGWC